MRRWRWWDRRGLTEGEAGGGEGRGRGAVRAVGSRHDAVKTHPEVAHVHLSRGTIQDTERKIIALSHLKINKKSHLKRLQLRKSLGPWLS